MNMIKAIEMTDSRAAVMTGLQVLERKAAGDPLCAYIYDLDVLAEHARFMKCHLPEACSLFYAVKANGEAPVLAALAPIVDGFEVASGGELAWVLAHINPVRLLFGGPGKTNGELRAALEAGVEALHVESVGELRRLAEIADKMKKVAPVILRLNLPAEDTLQTRLVMSGKPSPFGMDEKMLEDALQLIATTSSLNLLGLHVHTLSHQCDTQAHLKLIESHLKNFQSIRNRFGLQINLLNCGGGMGIHYQNPQASFDWVVFCAGVKNLLATHGQGIELRFEVGRYLTASCGSYLMEVIDIKKSYGEWFAIGRGGTHHFRLPQAQNHSHPVYVIERSPLPLVKEEEVTIVGQLCTPKDVLARNVSLSRLAVGDIMVFPLAGAYAWCISHQNFLMHPAPAKVFIKHGELLNRISST